MAKQVVVQFTKERETKGTHVFSEEGDPSQHHIGRLYVKKATAAEIGNPDKIKVTISA